MTTKEVNTVETEQQEFNESELENIMSEIESLEEEFVQESTDSLEELAIEKDEAPLNDFQEEVDQALGEIDDTINFDAEVEKVQEEMKSMTESSEAIKTTQSSPIIPTEQVIEVKNRPDTSAIFAELPIKKKKEETVTLSKTLSESVSFEDVISQSVATVDFSTPQVVKTETLKTKESISSSTNNQTTKSNVVPFEKEKRMSSSNNTNCDTTMNFTVSGQMTLSLNFTVGGQDIQFSIGEENGFCVTMGNGVKFSVPIEQINSIKQQKAG